MDKEVFEKAKEEDMDKDKKQISDHHDNVTRLRVETEHAVENYKYLRDKTERDNSYLQKFRNRVVDMKVNYYDKIIDLEIFLFKIFIPVLGISFAAGANILGINTYILQLISLGFIIIDAIFMIVTISYRKRIVVSEVKRLDKETDLAEKKFIGKINDLETNTRELKENIELALENEPHQQ